MVLVDTSVWVEHLRYSHDGLQLLLLEHEVMCHPFVIGELACGNLKNRDEIISLMKALPEASSLSVDEYLYFIDKHELYGRGIGLLDIHLLAAAMLEKVRLWTLDKRLNAVAASFDLNYSEVEKWGR